MRATLINNQLPFSLKASAPEGIKVGLPFRAATQLNFATQKRWLHGRISVEIGTNNAPESVAVRIRFVLEGRRTDLGAAAAPKARSVARNAVQMENLARTLLTGSVVQSGRSSITLGTAASQMTSAACSAKRHAVRSHAAVMEPIVPVRKRGRVAPQVTF